MKRVNATIIFTLFLLTLMFGAGVVSAAIGLTVGREALKGVTQPDTQTPSSKKAKAKQDGQPQAAFVLLKEADLIKQAKERTAADPAKAQPAAQKPSPQPQAQEVVDKPAAGFPVASQSQGVTLEVTATERQGESLILKVNLRNKGERSVQFLYSFLNATDDQGQLLTADARGLPTEVPNSGETFTGTISIPMALLNPNSKVSLSLSDYPDQQVQLQLADIPIAP